MEHSRDQATQLTLEDLQRTRAQMHEQMEMMQRILQANEKHQSPDSLVNVEPRTNADHRGLTDGSLEAGGRDPRPKHQKSFGYLCPSKETMAAEIRGTTRCVSAGERVSNQQTLLVDARRDANREFNAYLRVDAAAATSNRQISDSLYRQRQNSDKTCMK